MLNLISAKQHPDFNIVNDPYIEVVNNKDNLVICFGDSWTWGDSLGNAKARNRISDIEYRQQHVYGAKLSKMLDADFVNCAIPGIANHWIHDRLQVLIDFDISNLSLKYKNVWLVVTLTEIGRDFEYPSYVDEFKSFSTATDPNDILIDVEYLDFKKLNHIQHQLPHNCKLIVGRNFTNSFEQNLNLFPSLNFISENWVSVLLADQGIDHRVITPMMSFGISKFDKFMRKQWLNSNQYREWFNNVLGPAAQGQIDLLDQSQHNQTEDSKHPTEQGHLLWAKHIYSKIKDL